MLKAVVMLADGLHRWRLALVGAGSVGLVLFAVGILDGSAGGPGLAGLVLMIWASFLAAVGHFFSGRDWRAPSRSDTVAVRIRRRLTLALAWVAVVGMATLGGLLVVFTLRALSAV